MFCSYFVHLLAKIAQSWAQRQLVTVLQPYFSRRFCWHNYVCSRATRSNYIHSAWVPPSSHNVRKVINVAENTVFFRSPSVACRRFSSSGNTRFSCIVRYRVTIMSLELRRLALHLPCSIARTKKTMLLTRHGRALNFMVHHTPNLLEPPTLYVNSCCTSMSLNTGLDYQTGHLDDIWPINDEVLITDATPEKITHSFQFVNSNLCSCY